MITEWKPGENSAFRLFNEWSRAEALAIFAWDKASVTGSAVGARPVASCPFEMQVRARAEAVA